jgi:uncharacterized phage protein gp47/JayE
MPNTIGADGIEVKTRTELRDEMVAGFEAAYGSDINLEQSTPDGQTINIFVQSVLDMEDLLVQIYNSFDPDNAVGRTLDQRVAINGIQRQAGTYTITNVTVVVGSNCNLPGLDQTDEPPYTVSDNAGTKWFLIQSRTGVTAGSHVYSFRAEFPGANLTIPNTITIPVTIVLGVVSVNNPTTYTTLGLDEESDAALKVRRQKSVSLASQGYLAGLIAALENINGITSVAVYENKTGTTDINGVPSHSIWVIVSGTASDEEIATAIYQKRNAGAGMYGAESYIITQVDGSPFEINWDIVEPEDLYIEFDATSLDGVSTIDTDGIKDYLVANFVPGVNEQVNINDLATVVQQFDNNCLVTNAGFADNGGGPFEPVSSPSARNKQFVVSAVNISITVV